MEKPSYYAIIPADIRYDSDLPDKAKLLYGEITALCNLNGECWAGNEYFSKLYEVSDVSISQNISKLKEKGYIEIEYERIGECIKRRIIRLAVKKFFNGTVKKNFNGTVKKFFKENITSKNNITSINNIDAVQKTTAKINCVKVWLDEFNKKFPNKKYLLTKKEIGNLKNIADRCENEQDFINRVQRFFNSDNFAKDYTVAVFMATLNSVKNDKKVFGIESSGNKKFDFEIK